MRHRKVGEIGTVTSAGEAIADSQVLAASAVDCPSIFRARFQPTHTVWRQTQTGHHGHRPTTSAKESITSPQAPRPTRPHRVTLARSDEHSCLSLHRDPCRHLEPSGQTSPASALGPRPMPPTPPLAPDTITTKQPLAKRNQRAPTAREGLGRRNRQGRGVREHRPIAVRMPGPNAPSTTQNYANRPTQPESTLQNGAK